MVIGQNGKLGYSWVMGQSDKWQTINVGRPHYARTQSAIELKIKIKIKNNNKKLLGRISETYARARNEADAHARHYFYLSERRKKAVLNKVMVVHLTVYCVISKCSVVC